MNFKNRLLRNCRKPKSEEQLISIFSQKLVNDIRFNGKFNNRIDISLDLHGRRLYTVKKQKVVKKAKKELVKEKPAPKKKKKVNLRQELFVACRKTKTEEELVSKFGEKAVNDIRFKGKFRNRLDITLDQFGKRLYTTKKSIKAQRGMRRNQIRAALRSLVNMGSANNFEVCQNAIRENFADWSKTDSNFLQKEYENEMFKKNLTAPVLFSNLTQKIETGEIVKRVLTSFGACELKRFSHSQLLVNFREKATAAKCVQKMNNAVIMGQKVSCKMYTI